MRILQHFDHLEAPLCLVVFKGRLYIRHAAYHILEFAPKIAGVNWHNDNNVYRSIITI